MRKIEQMLVQLSKGKAVKTDSSIKVLQAESSDINYSSNNNSDHDSDSSNISKIETDFNNLKLNRLKNRVNLTSLTKNWYPKPTPPDI